MIYTDIYQLTGAVEVPKQNERGQDPTPPVTAKLFWNGRSQAVRLPRAFRFEGDEVTVRREGDAVILEPLRKTNWPRGYWRRVDRLADDLDLGRIDSLPVHLLDGDDD